MKLFCFINRREGFKIPTVKIHIWRVLKKKNVAFNAVYKESSEVRLNLYCIPTHMALYDSWNLPGGQINSSQIYQIRQNSVNHYLWNYLNVGFLNNPATTSKARSRIKIHSDAQWPEAHEKVEMLVEQVEQVATLTRDGPTESLALHWTWSTYTDTHYQGSQRIPACKIRSEEKRKI